MGGSIVLFLVAAVASPVLNDVLNHADGHHDRQGHKGDKRLRETVEEFHNHDQQEVAVRHFAKLNEQVFGGGSST